MWAELPFWYQFGWPKPCSQTFGIVHRVSCCLNLHSDGILSSYRTVFLWTHQGVLNLLIVHQHCSCCPIVIFIPSKVITPHEEGFDTQYYWLPISVTICFSNKKAYKYCLWSNWTWHDKIYMTNLHDCAISCNIMCPHGTTHYLAACVSSFSCKACGHSWHTTVNSWPVPH